MKGLGNGIFQSAEIIAGFHTPEEYYQLDYGDVDLDGDIDLLRAFDNFVILDVNDGSGNFETSWFRNDLELAKIAEFFDFDGDGDLDIICCSSEENKVVWHENLGSGEFLEESIIINTVIEPIGMCLFDVDSDDDQDILVSDSDNGIFVLSK